MQTLSKQIMSNLKMRQSYAESERENQGYQVGKSSKKNYQAKEGDTEIAQEDISLLETGACGAFVHGLEDEFQEVRQAATTSICKLALKDEEFAESCIDSLVGMWPFNLKFSFSFSFSFGLPITITPLPLLVDMFNDEIDEIRITAIESLMTLGAERGITLKEDQLQIVLSNLEDASGEIRSVLHNLLGFALVHSPLLLGFPPSLILFSPSLQNQNRFLLESSVPQHGSPEPGRQFSEVPPGQELCLHCL